MTDDRGDASAGRPGDLMTVVDAVPSAVPAVRALLRTWLDDLGWPDEDAEDIELAVNEAIANVVDHAYPPDRPGTATLHAWVAEHPAGRRVVVSVTDHGRWAAHQPPAPVPAARGHGLTVMSGCMAELHIQRSGAGTAVVMTSAAVPVPQPAQGP